MFLNFLYIIIIRKLIYLVIIESMTRLSMLQRAHVYVKDFISVRFLLCEVYNIKILDKTYQSS
jgi:hypothetical protein